MTTYLLNSAVLTAFGEYSYQPIELDEARRRLHGGFVSAVGHAGAAEFCTKLLGLETPLNRIAICMEQGDGAVVVRIKNRLPEGHSLTYDEVAAMEYELGLLTRLT